MQYNIKTVIKMKVHFVDNYLHNPYHRVTVAVVGVGGTGTQVLSNLARIDKSLIALGHPGIYVDAFDPDKVDNPNIGRQLFSEREIGKNKAQVYINRINRFFGLDWEGYNKTLEQANYNIIITCTDNIKSRIKIGEMIINQKKENNIYNQCFYWLDFGNSQKSGQFILGTSKETKQPISKKFEPISKLQMCTEMFNYNNINENDSGPSCSLAEALNSQDLFINSIIANLGCDLLWKMFRNLYIDYQGMFINLETNTFTEIKL